MSRRDKLRGIFDHTVEELATANFEEEEIHRGAAGPVRSMALTLGKMEDEARALQEALVAGHHVQDLDPALVDDSFVRDRLGAGELAADDPFVISIEENGQEVPVLVRPHPAHEGRYQLAYGHRRLRAVRLLGRKVRAIVREIADEDLVIAQGVENTARANLSYIERAVFAHTLETRGFGRSVIMKSLTTDKTELSKLISVASSIPLDIINAIGSAPGIGRRKWLAFAEAFTPKRGHALEQLLGSQSFLQAESDRRFELALSALSEKTGQRQTLQEWKPAEGKAIRGTIKADGKSYTLALKAADAAGFGDFITARLDELYERYRQTTGD